MSSRGRGHPNFKDQLALYTKLQNSLHPVGNGLWRYDDEWSDARVAEETERTLLSVRSFRLREFGHLDRDAPSGKARLDEDRMRRIENRLARLERILETSGSEDGDLPAAN